MDIPVRELAACIGVLESLLQSTSLEKYHSDVPIAAWDDELGRPRVARTDIQNISGSRERVIFPQIWTQAIIVTMHLREMLSDLTQICEENKDDSLPWPPGAGEIASRGKTEIQDIHQSLVDMVSDLNQMTMAMRLYKPSVPSRPWEPMDEFERGGQSYPSPSNEESPEAGRPIDPRQAELVDELVVERARLDGLKADIEQIEAQLEARPSPPRQQLGTSQQRQTQRQYQSMMIDELEHTLMGKRRQLMQVVNRIRALEAQSAEQSFGKPSRSTDSI